MMKNLRRIIQNILHEQNNRNLFNKETASILQAAECPGIYRTQSPYKVVKAPEDENEQRKFKQKYGYNLLTPRTWDEFDDIDEPV